MTGGRRQSGRLKELAAKNNTQSSTTPTTQPSTQDKGASKPTTRSRTTTNTTPNNSIRETLLALAKGSSQANPLLLSSSEDEGGVFSDEGSDFPGPGESKQRKERQIRGLDSEEEEEKEDQGEKEVENSEDNLENDKEKKKNTTINKKGYRKIVGKKEKKAVNKEQQEIKIKKEQSPADQEEDKEKKTEMFGANFNGNFGNPFVGYNGEPFIKMEANDNNNLFMDGPQKRFRSPGNEGNQAHQARRPRLDDYPFNNNAANLNPQWNGQMQQGGAGYLPGNMLNPPMLMSQYGYAQGMPNMNPMQQQPHVAIPNSPVMENPVLEDDDLELQISSFHKEELWKRVDAEDYVKGEEYAHRILNSDYIKGHKDLFSVYSALSIAQIQNGKLAEAKESCNNMYRHIKHDTGNREVEECYRRLAFCNLKMGDNEEACKWAKNAVIIWRKRGPEVAHLTDTVDLLIQALVASDREDKANAYRSLLPQKGKGGEDGNEINKENDEPSIEEAQDTKQTQDIKETQDTKQIQQGAFSQAMAMYDRRQTSESPTPAGRGSSIRRGTENSGITTEESIQIDNDAPGFSRVHRTDSPNSEDEVSRDRHFDRERTSSYDRRGDRYSEDRFSRSHRGDRYSEDRFSRDRRSGLKTYGKTELSFVGTPHSSEKPSNSGTNRDDRYLPPQSRPPMEMPFDKDTRMPRRYPTPEALYLGTNPVKNTRKDVEENLLYYVSIGNVKKIDLLLTENPLFGTSLRHEILVIAAEYGFPDVAEVLCKHKAIVNGLHSKTGLLPLHQCAIMGSDAFAKVVIENHGNFNRKIAHGLTPLHLAVIYNNTRIVKLFLDSGAAPNVPAGAANSGNTALHFAVKFGRSHMIPILIAQHATVNARNDMDQTPLHLAAKNGDVDIVKCLLKWKASTTIKDRRGNTPRDVANGSEVRRWL